MLSVGKEMELVLASAMRVSKETPMIKQKAVVKSVKSIKIVLHISHVPATSVWTPVLEHVEPMLFAPLIITSQSVLVRQATLVIHSSSVARNQLRNHLAEEKTHVFQLLVDPIAIAGLLMSKLFVHANLVTLEHLLSVGRSAS